MERFAYSLACLGFLGAICLPLCQAVEETVSLASILAPVVISPSQEDSAESEPETGKVQTESRKLETELIELPAILLRIEELVGASLLSGDHLGLRSNSKWDPLKIAQGAQWDLFLNNEFSPDTRGRWLASFSIEVEGKSVASRQLRLEASLLREVWLVHKRMVRGDTPNASSLKPVLRNIYLERGNPISASEELRDYELLRTVTEGRLLAWDDLQRRPAVRRGDIVEVLVNSGALQVKMRARSLEDGLMGESVAVKNLNSNHELVAVVVGDDQVQFYP